MTDRPHYILKCPHFPGTITAEWFWLCVYRSQCHQILCMRTFDENSCAISITNPRSLSSPRTQHVWWDHREKSRRASTLWDCRGKSRQTGPNVNAGFISSLILIEWKVLTRSLSVLHWVSWRPSLVVSYGTGLGWFLKQETGEHCKSWKCLLLLLMIWQSPGLPGWWKVNFITVTRRPLHPNIAAGLYYLDTSPGFLPTLCVKWSGFFYVHRVFLSYTRDRRLKVSSERLGNEGKAPCPRALLPGRGSKRGPPVWKSEALTARPRQLHQDGWSYLHWASKETYHFCRTTLIKIHRM